MNKTLIRGFAVIFRREIGAFFDSPIAYIFSAAFLVLAASIFMNSFFIEGIVSMAPFFENLPFLLILFMPALTMRTWAEERSQNTFELLMTLPIVPAQAVAGKFAAAAAFYLLVLAGSLPIVGMLLWLGSPDLGLIVASYLGAAFLGAYFVAFGVFASGLTTDQIVGYVVAALFGAFFVLTGQQAVVEVLDGLAPSWQAGTWLYETVSVMPHYEAMTEGVIRLSDVFYFTAMSGFFLWMNDVTLRRFRH